MKKLVIFTAALVFLSFSFANTAPQSAQDLFQKALTKERAEGKLEEAISLYQKVVKDAKDESLAARAQLQIGICYEKLGQEKAKLAQEAFQKVVDDYPGQLEIVRLAKNKLSSFLMASSFKKDFKIEKIGSGWWGNSVSSDGRYFAFVDWDTGDLAIRDLRTGQIRRLTDKGTWEESVAYAHSPIWSPDMKKVAYLWIDDNKISIRDGKDYFNFRIIGVDGSKPQTLVRYKYEGGWITPLDWSPSGHSILALFSKGEGILDIGQICIDDGSIKIIKTIETIEHVSPINAQFSPDGRYIAFSNSQKKNSRKRDIFLYSLDEKKELPIVEHPADDHILGWSPDGKIILFGSDRTGTKDAWMIRVSGERTQGDPLLVMKNIGLIRPIGFTQDGSFYYNTQGSDVLDVYFAEIDPDSGRILKLPEKEPLPYIGNNRYPDWSPDGKRLLYISRRGPNHNLAVLCVYFKESGEVLEILDERSPESNFLHAGRPQWSLDGHSILFTGSEPQTWGMYKVDAQTGIITPILKEQKGSTWNPPFGSPLGTLDGKSIYYIKGNQEEKFLQIIKRNIESGKEEALIQFPRYPNPTMALSPDGKNLALLMREKEDLRVLKVISLDKKEATEIYRFTLETGKNANISMDWSPDGRFIYFSKQRSDSEREEWDLLRISAKGGNPQKLGSTTHRFLHLSVHPNGKRITFSSVNDQNIPSEIWAMRNLILSSEHK